MISDLIKRIREAFDSSRIELISQIAISDSEYKELLQYVRNKARISTVQNIIPVDEVLSVAMVQIAIRVYSEGNYWNYFDEEIGAEVPHNKKYYFAQIFAKTIQKYNLFELKKDSDIKKSYVENIKAHAFVPNKYLSNYFDFLFSFYDRNLFRQLTENIDEDIEDLIEFVSDSLNKNGDVVSIEKSNNKPAQSYKLLKATRALIAQSTTKVVSDTFIDHLAMMDNYYYDGDLPQITDRFSEGFKKWVEKKNNEINSTNNISRKRKAKESFFYKPHFIVERSKNQPYLIIPSQKFRSEGFVNQARVEIHYKSKCIEQKLEVYKAYGVLVSEEIKFPIDDLFAEYKIKIYSNDVHEYTIPKKQYRVFDDDFTENSKLKKGKNYLLVEKGMQVKGNISALYINDAHESWDEFCYAEITDTSVIYIDDRPLSIIGEFIDRTRFEHVSTEYQLYKNDKRVQTAYKHPIVSFKIKKDVLSRARLYINETIYNITRECEVALFDLPNENDYVGVSIDINKLVLCKDSVYRISLDEPGKNLRLLTQYILITELRCYTSKPRFTFCNTAEISISGDYNISPCNSTQNIFGEYVVELSNDNNYGMFKLLFEEELYDLVVPLKVFKFGFEKQWSIIRSDYLWYTELKNELYIDIPGATDAIIYLNRNEEEYIIGEKYEEEKFRFEISKFVQKIKESTSGIIYLNLKFFDNRWRNISLYRIQRRPKIEYFSLACEDETLYIDAKYQSKNQLYVRFYDYNTEELVVETPIINGKTYITQLTKDGLYTLKYYEVESDEFGFGDVFTEIYKPKYKYGYIDISNLSNCKLSINCILNDDERLEQRYYYNIYDIQKIKDNTYTGKLTHTIKTTLNGAKAMQRTLFEKVVFDVAYDESNVQMISINIVEDNELFIPYYDSSNQVLISENNELLMSSKDINRFIPLYNDETTYEVDFRRVK